MVTDQETGYNFPVATGFIVAGLVTAVAVAAGVAVLLVPRRMSALTGVCSMFALALAVELLAA